jgi:hypothetical protein
VDWNAQRTLIPVQLNANLQDIWDSFITLRSIAGIICKEWKTGHCQKKSRITIQNFIHVYKPTRKIQNSRERNRDLILICDSYNTLCSFTVLLSLFILNSQLSLSAHTHTHTHTHLVTINSVWIGSRIYWTLIYTALYYNLQNTITHKPVSCSGHFMAAHQRRPSQLPYQDWILESQSHIHFTTDCLQPVISCWRQQRHITTDGRSVGQSILVSGTYLGPMTRYLLLSESCRFVALGRPLWRE